jgi:hypothetical protein
VTAVFLLGVFWRGASARAALITMLSGACLGASVFVIDFFKVGAWSLPMLVSNQGSLNLVWTEKGPWNLHSMISGFVMFLIAVVTLVVFSYVFPDARTAQRDALVWKTPLEPLRGRSWRYLGNYRVLAALLLLTMIGLYWHFRGDQNYYPVNACVRRSDGAPVVGVVVSFESDSPRFHFSEVTDAKGRFVYGSAMKAGGAPAGIYRAKVVSAQELPAGTTKGDESLNTIPARYGSFDSSGLQVRCEPNQNHWEIVLNDQ